MTVRNGHVVSEEKEAEETDLLAGGEAFGEAEVMGTLDGCTEVGEDCGTAVSFVDCERMGEVQSSRSKRVQLQTCGPIVRIARAHLLVQFAGGAGVERCNYVRGTGWKTMSCVGDATW